jgi:hypothetical protein
MSVLVAHVVYMQAVWNETLAAVNMAAVWERKEYFESIRAHERRSAKAFGVDSVFTTSHLSLSGAYVQFLQVRPASAHQTHHRVVGHVSFFLASW